MILAQMHLMPRPPAARIAMEPHELVVDNFAGGGGVSAGIEAAIGRPPDIAINHDRDALAMHARNHPYTRHLCEDVWRVDPVVVCRGLPVALAWFSPDCKHFSRAKGGKPRSAKIRGLAWVAVRWARAVRPRVIVLENVEEFTTWGPIGRDGRPCPERRGQTFCAWVRRLERLGYEVEWRLLRACDYGAPTIRRRLFVIARRDGRPIRWPAPTHGDGPGLRRYRTAAEILDWSLPCPSIFERRRPLAEATLRRIARGIDRFVLRSAEPFVVPVSHPRDARVHDVREPLRTVTSSSRSPFALVAPSLVQTSYGERKGQAPRCLDLHRPLGTVVAGGQKHALVAAFLAKHYGGNESPGSSLDAPVSTVTARDHHALVASHVLKLHGSARDGRASELPLPTVRAQGTHLGEVRALLLKYYGHGTAQDPREPLHTVPSRDRFAVVTVAGEQYAIADIGMRMLQPRELYRAQGFRDDYVIDVGADGRPLTKTAQVRMCGNSVPPPMAAAVVRANLAADACEEISEARCRA